jgi:opacity protein-like surface antigen
MRILSLTIASLLSATAATPAFAQDAGAGSPFTGFYGGVEIGAAQKSSKATVTPLVGAAASRSSTKTSADFGGFVGYGYTFDNGLYLGGEASLNSNSGKTKPTTLAGISVREKSNYDAALTARLGYMFNETTMVYGIGGVAQRQSSFNLANNTRKKENVTGSVFGLGVAHSFGENLIGRVELDRSDFGKKSFSTPNLPRLRYEPAATRLSVGVAYKF